MAARRKSTKPKATTAKKSTRGGGKRRREGPARASYLQKLDSAVRGHFAAATDLSTFLAGAGELSAADRKLIVRQALVLIEQNYAHLPLKRAMHSIDPVQRLKLLLQTLELAPAEAQPTEVDFHREMTEIFTSVRDLHTNYLLPEPFAQMSAFLPFIVEDYFEGGERRYIVSHVAPGFDHATFRPGVELVYWNGMPIERAIHNNAERYAGSNREARHARGVATMTVRALRIAPPPDEEWVDLRYRQPGGPLEELRVDWQVNPPLPSGVESDGLSPAAAASLGLDLEQDIVQRVRLALFAPQAVAARREAAERTARGDAFGDLESTLPTVLQARSVTTPAGEIGYLRIRTFGHWPPEQFVAEVVRLLAALPQRGLIVDVRGNGGGVIMNGELILQTLTPRRIEPEPLQFLNTPLNLDICRRHDASSTWTDLSPWVESLQQSLRTGSMFSAGFPITDPEACNSIGQKYFGPVVLITDALCYSTTDIFAAGFQDHEIGPVLGVDGNTGAGGANVWEHRFFVSDVLPGAVYEPLPNGAGMRVSIRRTLRVGRRAGAPVEDLGVQPDHRHFLTRRDLLEENADLIAAAASLLAAAGPVRSLRAEVQAASSTQASVTVTTVGIDRLDVYLRGRPLHSVDVDGGPSIFTVPRDPSGQPSLEIRGFDHDELVARYRTAV
jgi:C-terminal processing protease CtpA/Prc